MGGAQLLLPWLLLQFGDACLRADRPEEAIEALNEGRRLATANGERWCEPELLRVLGVAELAAGQPRDAAVERDPRGRRPRRRAPAPRARAARGDHAGRARRRRRPPRALAATIAEGDTTADLAPPAPCCTRGRHVDRRHPPHAARRAADRGRRARARADVPVPLRGAVDEAPRRGGRDLAAARADAPLGGEHHAHRAPGDGAPRARLQPADRDRRGAVADAAEPAARAAPLRPRGRAQARAADRGDADALRPVRDPRRRPRRPPSASGSRACSARRSTRSATRRSAGSTTRSPGCSRSSARSCSSARRAPSSRPPT